MPIGSLRKAREGFILGPCYPYRPKGLELASGPRKGPSVEIGFWPAPAVRTRPRDAGPGPHTRTRAHARARTRAGAGAGGRGRGREGERLKDRPRNCSKDRPRNALKTGQGITAGISPPSQGILQQGNDDDDDDKNVPQPKAYMSVYTREKINLLRGGIVLSSSPSSFSIRIPIWGPR